MPFGVSGYLRNMRSEIVIRELAGAKRVLRLLGAGLPRQGASWGGKNRLATTWYPGNAASATQQVLGPIEAPSQWAGVWNTTRLYRTPCIFEPTPGAQLRITFADALREVFEDFLRRSALLQVYWINAEPKTFGARTITRIGRASDWSFQYQRVDDLEWSVTWEWTSRGSGQQKVVQLRSDGTNQENVALMQAISAAVDESVNKTKIQLSKRTIPNSANKFSLEQLGQLLDAPSRLMRDFSQSMNRISNRVKAIGDLINRTRGLPYELANQMLDVANNAIATSNQFVDSISRTPPELFESQQKLSTLTRAASYYKGGIDTANAAVLKTYPITAQIRAQIDTRRASGAGGKAEPTAAGGIATLGGQKTQVQVHIVKEGDTLIGISVRYYGVPEGVYGIAFGNGLRLNDQPPVGKVLIIPPLNAGPGRSALPPVQPASGPSNLPGGVGQTSGSP